MKFLSLQFHNMPFENVLYITISGYYPTQPPGLRPPPYDSQEGEAYRLVADDEEDGSSPLEAMEAENGTNQNGVSKLFRGHVTHKSI